MKEQNVVIFHDFLIERGGGERVVLCLASFFKALIVTCFYDRTKTYKEFENLSIIAGTSARLAKIRPAKLLKAFIFFSKQLKGKRNFFSKNFDKALFSGFYSIYFSKFISLPKFYYIQAEPLSFVFKRSSYGSLRFSVYRAFYKVIKNIEKEAIKSMDCVVANSNYTKRLYEKTFSIKVRRVIYPPVNVSKFYFKEYGDFYLAVGRLYPHKRIHLVAKVFAQLRSEKLVIVGDGPLRKFIERVARDYKNITYLGSVSDRKLRELYAECKAVIYIPEKEHFGIIPIEANAAGKPAIVSNEGGLPEAIINKKTGIVINRPYSSSLRKVILNFSTYKFSKQSCIKNARRFEKRNFLLQFHKLLDEN